MPDRIGPSRRSMFDVLASLIGENLGAKKASEPTYDMGFRENVTVKPISPNFDPLERYGKDRMREITLGSPGKVPEGVYLPPETYETEIPKNYPNMRASYEEAKRAHPDLTSRVRALNPRKDWLGTNQTGGIETEGQTLRGFDFNPVMEFESPEDRLRTIEHELVHFGQSLNRPNRYQPERADEFPAYFSTEGRYSSPLMSQERAKEFISNTDKATKKVYDDEFEDDLEIFRSRGRNR